jgi:hypothetical protein
VLDALKPLADQGRVLKKNFRSGTPKGTLRNELSKLIVAFFVRHPDATNKEARWSTCSGVGTRRGTWLRKWSHGVLTGRCIGPAPGPAAWANVR